MVRLRTGTRKHGYNDGNNNSNKMKNGDDNKIDLKRYHRHNFHDDNFVDDSVSDEEVRQRRRKKPSYCSGNRLFSNVS